MSQDSLKLGLVTYQLGHTWDIETLIKNCEETGWKAVELRTEHAHGVEPELGADERHAVRSRFEKSGVRLLSLGSTCEYHSPDPEELKRQIAGTKEFIQLAADVGAAGVKVRPNGLAKDAGVSEEETLRQIGEALKECGPAAQEAGVEIWLEVHGRETSEPSRIRTIMEVCDHPAVGVCWNCNPADVKNGSIKENYDLLSKWIRILHVHDLWEDYPYQELFNEVVASGFSGYALVEAPASSDAVRLMHYYRTLFDYMLEKAAAR